MLNSRGYDFSTSSHFDVICEIKEKRCYASETDYAIDMNGHRNLIDYSLPNGSAIKIGNEWFKTGEVLFRHQ